MRCWILTREKQGKKKMRVNKKGKKERSSSVDEGDWALDPPSAAPNSNAEHGNNN